MPSGPVTIEVIDSAGSTLRHLSSVAGPPAKEAAKPPHPNFWVRPPESLPVAVGLNRANWDLRLDAPAALNHSFEINANPGLTPTSPEGVIAPPGTYTIKLTVGGTSQSQKVTVTNDPRSPATPAEVRAQYTLLRKNSDGAKVAYDGFQQVEAMRAVLTARLPKDSTSATAKAIAGFRAKLDSVQNGAGNPGPARRPAPSFAALNAQLAGVVLAQDNADQAPTAAMLAGYALACRELGAAVRKWSAINGADLVALNAVLSGNGIPPVPAARGLTAPTCSAPPAR